LPLSTVVVRTGLLVYYYGTLIDETTIGYDASLILSRQPFPSLSIPLAQVQAKLGIFKLAGVEMLVDRFMPDVSGE